MARYIDAEALTDYMLERYNDLREKHGDYDHYTTGYGDAIDVIEVAPTVDVAPRAEVANEIIFDLACKLHTMLPHKIHPIPIDGKLECNTYELGQEHVIFNTLKYLDDLKKKYTEGQK